MPRASYPVACLLLILLLAGKVAASTPHGSPLPAQKVQSIDRLFAEALTRRQMPGASVAVAFDDGSIFSRHYGSATLDPVAPVVGETRFRIGSISKLVTSLAMLRLVEEDRVELDAPVATLFPSDQAISKLPPSVTIRRLLNHTSGLPDFTRPELEAKVARGVSTDADLMAVLERPLRYEPGSDWAYADAPFRILSRAIEKVSGLPYGRYISERLAPALGLHSLRLCEPGSPRHASGFLSRNGQLQPEPAYAIRGLLGEGGLCATAEDLARLPKAVATASWIGAATLKSMVAPTRLTDGSEVDYGLGVRGGLLGPLAAWGHTGGGLDGSWASVVHYPDRGVTVAVTANGTGSDVDAATLQGAVAAIVLGIAPPKEDMSDPVMTSAVIGAYERGGRVTCIVRMQGRLFRTRPDRPSAPTPLLHQGAAVFGRSDYPLDRLAFQIEDGSSIGYRVYYDGLFAEYWRRASNDACENQGPPG